MGFCLFEDAEYKEHYLAVNSDFIDGFHKFGSANNSIISRITFKKPVTKDGRPCDFYVFGMPDKLNELVRLGAKVGVQKSKLGLLNKLSSKPMPLLISNPQRIMVARELQPEEFMGDKASISTATQLYYEDGTTRYISERPGQFARLTNQGGLIPMMNKNLKE